MNFADTQSLQKWNAIYANATIGESAPANVLAQNAHLLPTKGRALDFASGLAANAIFLAQRGLEAEAWDISDIVSEKVNVYARSEKLSLNAKSVDLTIAVPSPESYDVIVVAHYLDRKSTSALANALKPGGLIFYQTFSQEVTPSYSGPKNPDFRLGKNEMLELFSSLRVVVYREEGLIGDIAHGARNLVFFVGQRR